MQNSPAGRKMFLIRVYMHDDIHMQTVSGCIIEMALPVFLTPRYLEENWFDTMHAGYGLNYLLLSLGRPGSF